MPDDLRADSIDEYANDLSGWGDGRVVSIKAHADNVGIAASCYMYKYVIRVFNMFTLADLHL